MYKQIKRMDFKNEEMVLRRCEELSDAQAKIISMRGEEDPLVEFIGKTIELNKVILDLIQSESVFH